MFFTIVWNEAWKRFIIMWRYRFNVAAQLLMFIMLFLGIGYLIGQGRIEPAKMTSIMLGFMVWYFAFAAISFLSMALLGEAQIGTLEQMYMSPAPPELILLGRVFANFLTTILLVFVMTAALSYSLNLRIEIGWPGVLVFGMTIVGVFGFGFMLGGAVLVFKRVAAFASIIQNGLLFLNGTLLPVEQMPAGLRWVAHTLPTTQGIKVLREVTLEHRSLGAVWENGGISWLVLHSLFYLLLGWSVFKWGESVAKRQGSLGQY